MKTKIYTLNNIMAICRIVEGKTYVSYIYVNSQHEVDAEEHKETIDKLLEKAKAWSYLHFSTLWSY